MSGAGAEQIRALVCDYGPSIRGTRLLAIIRAYIDDSGNSDGNGNPVFVLAGYVSSAEKWEQFSDEWEAERDKDPPLHGFKMAHVNQFRGCFDGWGREDRDERVQKLADIVQRHTVLRMQASIFWQDYNEILRGNLPGLLESPYVWLFWRLLSAMTEWQISKGVRSKVDFIFDDQGPFGLEAATWFQYLRDNTSLADNDFVGSVTFKHDDDVLPLKAADMWAWHVRRYLADGAANIQAGQPIAPVTPLMKSLMHCPLIGDILDREGVIQLRDNFQKGVSAALSGETPPWFRAPP